MDINAIATVNEDDGVLVHLKDINGDLLYDGEGDGKAPVTIRVAGTYSKTYRSALAGVIAKNTKAAQRGKKLDAETGEANALTIEAACILEWSFTAGGKSYPITVDNWKALVVRQPQWQEQVRAEMGDHERFSSGS